MASQEKFSEQERKVIELLLQGNSNKQIAVVLGVSIRTIEFHLTNVYKELGVSSRTEAVLKLSKERLRESTDEKSDELRNSTVEKAEKATENGENPTQLRRQKMKNIVYVLTSGVLLILIIGIGLFGKQISNLFAQTPQVSKTPQLAKVTDTPVATLTRIPTTTPTLSYQVLSPTTIKKDNLTFEVSANLISCAELQFDVHGAFPSDYPTQLPPGNEGDYLFIVEQGGVTLSSPSVSLKLDPRYGGGGGSDINGIHVRGQGAGYFINPPLTSNQKIHLTALVNFNDVFGITNPVRFELDLTAGQCQ